MNRFMDQKNGKMTAEKISPLPTVNSTAVGSKSNRPIPPPNHASKDVGIIVIAGGNSSRLGQSKQLVKINGSSLLNKTLTLAAQLNLPTACVLGFDKQKMLDNIDLQRFEKISEASLLKVIDNKQWQTGMGTSIAKGVSYFEQRSHPLKALMILLCDQYRLDINDLQRLISRWEKQPDRIVASEYDEQLKHSTVSHHPQKCAGAPAIFPASFFAELLTLTEKGARKILEREKRTLIRVPMHSAAFDLDTKNDLQKLRSFENELNLETMSS